MAAAVPSSWEPIYASISLTIKLATKLFDQIEKYKENKQLAESINLKISVLHERLKDYAQGSEGSALHTRIQKSLLETIICINTAIIKLTNKIEHQKMKAFGRAVKISEELQKIDASLESLKTDIYVFAVGSDIRKEQNVQFEFVKEIHSFISGPLKHFVEVFNANAANNDVFAAMQSLCLNNSEEGEFETREKGQEDALANIPDLKREVKSLSLEDKQKAKLMEALESAESSWMYSVDSFSIDQENGRDKFISRGGFKDVYKGHLKVRTSQEEEFTNVPVAVLQYNIGPGDLAMTKGGIWREILLSWKISHPCIVKTLGAFWPKECEEGNPPKIFSELMTNNLRNAKSHKALQNPKTRYSIAVDIAEGLCYLHSRKIVHRDLKPENILLRIFGDELVSRAKLCDFGASREIRTTFLTNSHSLNQLTPLYAPPEEFMGEKSTYAYDLWSYGLILCWTDGDGRKAPAATPFTISELVRTGKLLQQSEKWVESIENKVLKECARKCISKNPKDRGTMADVLIMLQASETAAMYADAHELYTKEDYAGAVAILEEMVSGENQDALFLLACCNSQGQGMQKDEVRAAELYGMAADKGHPEAQFRLAEFSADGRGVDQDRKRAAELYKLAADNGHAEAQFQLGKLYADGKDVDQDYKRATEFYKRAADQGHAAAPYYLGALHLRGKHIEQDENLAAKLFELSAKRGYAKAQYKLGLLYKAGRIVTRDINRAVDLFQSAADQGHADAMDNLGAIYYFGEGVDKDLNRVAELRKHAADRRDEDARRRSRHLLNKTPAQGD